MRQTTLRSHASAWYFFIVAAVLFSVGWISLGQEAPAPDAALDRSEATNAVPISAAFQELQERVRATQHAIEANRQEARLSAVQTARSLSNALQTVQANFAAQRARDLEAIQDANRAILRVTGAFGAVGFLALVFIGFLQWRLSRGMIEVSTALSEGYALPAPSTSPALGPGETPGPALLNTLERHEERINELEQMTRPEPRLQKRPHRKLEQRLFPRTGDYYRRRQFRALRTALILGLLGAAVVVLVLYLVYTQARV